MRTPILAMLLLAVALPARAQNVPAAPPSGPAEAADPAAAEDPGDGRIVGGTPADPSNVWQAQIYTLHKYDETDVAADKQLPLTQRAFIGEKEPWETTTCAARPISVTTS